jgi:hypothetical protein
MGNVDIDFEDYVREILHDMPAGLNRQQFRARCIPDINAGYRAEVVEAERRYFSTQENR